jgi:hypothetical protein
MATDFKKAIYRWSMSYDGLTCDFQLFDGMKVYTSIHSAFHFQYNIQ